MNLFNGACFFFESLLNTVTSHNKLTSYLYPLPPIKTGVSEGSGSPDSFGFFISTVGVTLGIMIVGGGTTLLWMHQSRILVA